MAKLLLVLALACFAVVSVSCSRGLLKRGKARLQAKRQTREAKQCCLPSQFSLSAALVATSQYGRYKTESTANIDIAYSQANNAVYWKASSEEGQSLSSLIQITSDSIKLKFAVGSCSYKDYLIYSDSYLMKLVQDKICLPAELATYVGDEKLNGQDVEVFDIYTFNVTILGTRVDSYGSEVKLRAVRLEDGSCIPVQVEMKTENGNSNYRSLATFELLSPEISREVDSSKFESACSSESD